MIGLDELFDAWRDGELDEAGERAVDQVLADPGQRREWLRRCADERQLRERITGGVDAAACLQRVRPAAGTGRGQALWLLAAGGLVAIWLVWRLALAEPPPVGSVVATGEVLLSDDQDGERPPGPVRVGDRLRCGADGQATLGLRSGSRLQLTGPAALVVRSATAMELSTGRLYATVVAADRDFTVTTPHARSRVLGTRYTIVVDRIGSRLQVEEGRVQWQPTGEPAIEVAAGGEAVALAPRSILQEWDFTGGAVQQSGVLDQPIELVGLAPEMFTAAGLRVRREDFVRSAHIPVVPPTPVLRQRLAEAEAVVLWARVRLADPIPPNLSLATLFCRDAPADRRMAALRWLADPALATTGWHEVEVRWERRSGTKVCRIDGQEQSRYQVDWPFASWTDRIGLLLHRHQDGETSPVPVEYARLSIQVID